MHLTCPSCGREIRSDDINIQMAMAKCAACHAVFGFADKIEGAGTATGPKPQVELPKRFSVQMDPDGLVITRRWFSPVVFFLLFFCVFWDGFLLVWYFMAFTQNGPLMMKLFPLLHVAVGLGLTYATLTAFVNKTTIRVNYTEIAVRHGPLPWPGNKSLPRSEVEQLFCQEKMSRGESGYSSNYEVGTIGMGGKRDKIVTGLTSPEQALFIEQQIEGYLGIRDRPVAGEMRG